jgi:6-phospho-beta-glucosidase
MKIAILGAGGVRTPLIVSAMARRQADLGLTDLALMDIDGPRLSLIARLLPPTPGFAVRTTVDAAEALADADFVITTFRVGGIAARVVDEAVPLRYDVLGQETTGPGGFAMALRSIPVLLGYIDLMREHCPRAWLINFANPAGLLAEAAARLGTWPRTVGICDAPESMLRVAAAILQASPGDVYLDYFGLNHLGWVRGVQYGGCNHLPRLIAMICASGGMPGLPFAPDFIASLGMIPNEYLFYYYHSREAVDNLRRAGLTRGQQLVALNDALFATLACLAEQGDVGGMREAHERYLRQRGDTYMTRETGSPHGHSALDPALVAAIAGQGYAGIALDVIEALSGGRPRHMVLNVPNAGAVPAMEADAVVEIPAHVSANGVRALAVGDVPPEQLGLMLQVKAYERLTIAAIAEASRRAAVHALAVHPLVRDLRLAERIVDDYAVEHGAFFPPLR